jgi:hypothetical protein
MKKLIWKLQYTLAIRRLVGVSLWTGWQMAESTIEDMGDDIEIWSGKDAAEDERDAWASSV